jgi:hypothetical protein
MAGRILIESIAFFLKTNQIEDKIQAEKSLFSLQSINHQI